MPDPRRSGTVPRTILRDTREQRPWTLEEFVFEPLVIICSVIECVWVSHENSREAQS